MSARVIRRPVFGWGFRSWLRGAVEGIRAAYLVLCCWGFCQCVYGLMGYIIPITLRLASENMLPKRGKQTTRCKMCRDATRQRAIARKRGKELIALGEERVKL